MWPRASLLRFGAQKSVAELLRDSGARQVAQSVDVDPVDIGEVGEGGVSHRFRCPGRVATVLSIAPHPIADLDAAGAHPAMHATSADESTGSRGTGTRSRCRRRRRCFPRRAPPTAAPGSASPAPSASTAEAQRSSNALRQGPRPRRPGSSARESAGSHRGRQHGGHGSSLGSSRSPSQPISSAPQRCPIRSAGPLRSPATCPRRRRRLLPGSWRCLLSDRGVLGRPGPGEPKLDRASPVVAGSQSSTANPRSAASRPNAFDADVAAGPVNPTPAQSVCLAVPQAATAPTNRPNPRAVRAARTHP